MSGWQRARRVAGFDTVFRRYVRGLVARSFAAVWVREGASLPERGGYVAVANHNAWWDGFIPYLLQHACAPRVPFAILMSDPELRRFPFFRFCGAFSIDATSLRAARASIVYAASLARGGEAVWIFPDGELRPPGTPLRFTGGFAHAAREAGVCVVPVAMRFVQLDKQRPEVFVAFGAPLEPDRSSRERAQEAVAALLATIDADVLAGGRANYRAALTGRIGVDDRVALPRR